MAECMRLRSFMCVICLKVNTQAQRRKAKARFTPLELANNPLLLAALVRRVPTYSVDNHHVATGLCSVHGRKLKGGMIEDDDLIHVRQMLRLRPLSQTHCTTALRCRLCRIVVGVHYETSTPQRAKKLGIHHLTTKTIHIIYLVFLNTYIKTFDKTIRTFMYAK